jgi:hypothetical protein
LFQHTLRFLQDVAIPETENAVSSTLQIEGSSPVVGQLIDVLSSIGFNDSFGFEACKIDDIPIDYHLAPEFETLQATRPQVFPQCSFSLTGLPAEDAGVRQ